MENLDAVQQEPPALLSAGCSWRDNNTAVEYRQSPFTHILVLMSHSVKKSMKLLCAESQPLKSGSKLIHFREGGKSLSPAFCSGGNPVLGLPCPPMPSKQAVGFLVKRSCLLWIKLDWCEFWNVQTTLQRSLLNNAILCYPDKGLCKG